MTEEMKSRDNPPPDNLTQKIGVLTRREVEARVLAPVIDALGERFGREEVIEVVKETIIEIARKQGAELARAMDGSGCDEFMDSLQFWTKDDALRIDVLERSEEILNFDVKRCRYAEMYKALGVPELGKILSCNRDFALIEGFNEKAALTRARTIMDDSSHCDFRYKFPKRDE